MPVTILKILWKFALDELALRAISSIVSSSVSLSSMKLIALCISFIQYIAAFYLPGEDMITG